jgi:hypothetical protein
MQPKEAIESDVPKRKAGRAHAGESWGAIPLDIAHLLGILVRIEVRRQIRLRTLREKGDH